MAKGKSLFLIHHPLDTPYHVCLPYRLSHKYPGIEVEIEAAIKIWGFYLKRNLQVQIHLANFERIENFGKEQEQFVDEVNQLYENCPSSTDIVIDESMTGRQGLGFTQYFTYSNRTQVTSYKRVLILNDTFEFKTLEQTYERSYFIGEIMSLLRSRKLKTKYERNTFNLLGILIHEFGHVWGLCDQYSSAIQKCDPEFSSLEPSNHSIMYSQSSAQTIYLTDDDIMGIFELGKRFGDGFPSYDSFKDTVKINFQRVDLVKGNGHFYGNSLENSASSTQSPPLPTDSSSKRTRPIETPPVVGHPGQLRAEYRNNNHIVFHFNIPYKKGVNALVYVQYAGQSYKKIARIYEAGDFKVNQSVSSHPISVSERPLKAKLELKPVMGGGPSMTIEANVQ